jgi:hypothetical protein
VGHTDFQVGEDAIHDFLSAYQSVSRLSMGELWAMPSTLRIALIHGLCPLICRIHERLREREQAAFWANRLLASLRRGPVPLMAVLAEMARTLPRPGAHFAVELIGHLHDEDAVHMPVQSWLEQSLEKTLADIVTQDRQGQTEDRVSISNAVGSLREFAQLDWRSIFERQSRVEAILKEDPAAVYAGRTRPRSTPTCSSRPAMNTGTRWSGWRFGRGAPRRTWRAPPWIWPAPRKAGKTGVLGTSGSTWWAGGGPPWKRGCGIVLACGNVWPDSSTPTRRPVT